MDYLETVTDRALATARYVVKGPGKLVTAYDSVVGLGKAAIFAWKHPSQAFDAAHVMFFYANSVGLAAAGDVAAFDYVRSAVKDVADGQYGLAGLNLVGGCVLSGFLWMSSRLVRKLADSSFRLEEYISKNPQ